jgi:hypothetical protein
MTGFSEVPNFQCFGAILERIWDVLVSFVTVYVILTVKFVDALDSVWSKIAKCSLICFA